MKYRSTILLISAINLFCNCIAAAPVSQQQCDRATPIVEKEVADLLSLYKQFHTHPELSFQEAETSARVGEELTRAGFKVTSHVGGYGVVGVFENGPGKTVLVRTDMDGLPVKEQTGLPYASKVVVKDPQGNEVPVMHACGHDLRA